MKKASLRTENVLRNMIIFIMCINVTILNLNAVEVTVQTNLNEQNIGFYKCSFLFLSFDFGMKYNPDMYLTSFMRLTPQAQRF